MNLLKADKPCEHFAWLATGIEPHSTKVQPIRPMSPSRSIRTSTRTMRISSVIRLILFLLLGMFSPSALAIEDCYSQLLDADENHDGNLSASEYVGAVNAMSGGAFKNTFLIPFRSLPSSLKDSFQYLACICPGVRHQANCCDGTIDISRDNVEVCVTIDLALHPVGKAVPVEGRSLQDNQPIPLQVATGFVISNVAGITASDMVEGFDSYEDLTFAFDLLAEEVVNVINDTSVEYVINSGSLNEIYDMDECPAEIEPEANLLCQSIFTTMTILSNDPLQEVTAVREVYRQVLQDSIDLGFLQETLLLTSLGDSPVLNVENGSLPVRPPTVPIVAEVSFAFAVSTDTNITLDDDLLQQLGLAVANRTTELTNENMTALVNGSGSIDDLVSIDCPVENSTESSLTPSIAPSSTLSDLPSGSFQPSVAASAFLPSSTPSDLPSGSFQPSVSDLPSGSFQPSVSASAVTTLPPNANVTGVTGIETAGTNTVDNILLRRPGAWNRRKLQTSPNVTQCYTLYGSFQVELLSSSVDALDVQQAYNDSFEAALSSGDLQETVNSVPWLAPVTVLVDDDLVFSPPTSAPSSAPSLRPSITQIPSRLPSLPPSMVPSFNPSASAMPSSPPSDIPSVIPSDMPSGSFQPSVAASNFLTASTVPSSPPSGLPSGSFQPSDSDVTLKASSGVSTGVIAGAVVGIVVFVGLSGVGLFFGYRYREEIKEKMMFPKKKHGDADGEDQTDSFANFGVNDVQADSRPLREDDMEDDKTDVDGEDDVESVGFDDW